LIDDRNDYIRKLAEENLAIKFNADIK
jgi:hypothetical protein